MNPLSLKVVKRLIIKPYCRNKLGATLVSGCDLISKYEQERFSLSFPGKKSFPDKEDATVVWLRRGRSKVRGMMRIFRQTRTVGERSMASKAIRIRFRPPQTERPIHGNIGWRPDLQQIFCKMPELARSEGRSITLSAAAWRVMWSPHSPSLLKQRGPDQ